MSDVEFLPAWYVRKRRSRARLRRLLLAAMGLLLLCFVCWAWRL
jgi:hypothetical protein